MSKLVGGVRGAGPARSASGAVAAALTVLAAVAACDGDHEYEPPDRARQVAEAESLFTAGVFDTLTWRSDSLRLYTGNELYAAECRLCHGYLGRGRTAYAREHDLPVPSLVRPDWPLADHPDSVRKRIYTGHQEGMPSWGVWRLSPRAIDAIAYYVLNQLRTEATGETPP